jgi:hypothetical protein
MGNNMKKAILQNIFLGILMLTVFVVAPVMAVCFSAYTLAMWCWIAAAVGFTATHPIDEEYNSPS